MTRPAPTPAAPPPARHTDLDHIRPWPAGSTSIANLHALCRHHHRAKTAGRIRCHRDPGTGITTWTDRHRRQITTEPPRLPTAPDPPDRRGTLEQHQPITITELPDDPPF